VTSPSTFYRATCPRCLRPQATCLCALVRPTAHHTEVLVLQHPQEQRQAKNSVALLRLSLARCEVVVGERFAPGALLALLQRPGRDTRLLYPDVPNAPAPAAQVMATTALATTACAPIRLVVLDATWRKSLRMLIEHPALAALARLSLDAPAPTRYRAIRAARRADQVSTLEATVQALAMLEGPSFDAAPLLDAFDRFVAGVAARKRPEARGAIGPGLDQPALRRRRSDRQQPAGTPTTAGTKNSLDTGGAAGGNADLAPSLLPVIAHIPQETRPMDADTLKTLQAPIKARFRDQPETASITLRAQGRLGDGLTCSVETGQALVRAGLHPATGGDGLSACSGDMLLQALVACAGVTLNAVATALAIPLRDARLTAEGDLDFRGTLGVAKDAPVGFRSVRLHVDLDSDATPEQVDTLLKLTERYCVIFQTLAHPPELAMTRSLSSR
jgi:DTW domain-containing protein YfiP/uncharacterized OsmC-like protein